MDAADRDSFREFVETRWGKLLRTAVLLVADRGHAEDLVAEVFTRLWFVWPRLRHEAPDAYARRTLTNCATSWRRRRWHGERPTALLPDAPSAQDVGRDVVDRDVRLRALRSLPARQRAAVVMRVVEDLSEADVATALGCSVGTVKSLTSRGLARLRSAGSDHDDAPGGAMPVVEEAQQ